MDIRDTDWYKTLAKYDDIIIFGAKENAKTCRNLVRVCGFEVSTFVVSDLSGNVAQIDGTAVAEFGGIEKERKENGLVIVSQSYEKMEEMSNILKAEGFRNILAGGCQITDQLTQGVRNYCESILGEIRSVKELADVATHGPAAEDVLSVCIYVVTSHLNRRKPQRREFNNRFMDYIQAGRALTDKKLCRVGDDTGENISELNPYYCEVSAGYWIAKNDRHGYVGLCHYSRWLDMDDRDVEKVVGNGVDVVLPMPVLFQVEMVLILEEYGEMLENAIRKVDPAYADAMEVHFSTRMLIPGNICIAKRGVFVQYYEWMYAVLQEMERALRDRHGEIPKRLLGYMAEHLTNIYFLKHKEYKTVYAPLIKLF